MLLILRMCIYADLLVLLMCCSMDMVWSSVTPRTLMCFDVHIVSDPILSVSPLCASCFVVKMMNSVLLVFSFSALLDIHRHMSAITDQCVQIDNVISEFADLVCGVPQGSVLGPFKFSIYMLLIGLILQHHGIDHHIYADDTCFFCCF